MAARRLCIIGDSHAVALKAGWETMKDERPDWTLDFFAAQRALAQFLEVEDDRLVAMHERLRESYARSAGGKTAIEAGYDGYVVCGLGLSLHSVKAVYNRGRAPGHAPRDDVPQVTREAFLAAVAEEQRMSLAVRTLDLLRRISQAPAMLIANPLPSETASALLWVNVKRNGDAQDLAEAFFEACALVAAARNAVFLQPPAETLADATSTRDEFSREAARMIPNQPDDHHHMNGRYGAILLRAVFARLDGG